MDGLGFASEFMLELGKKQERKCEALAYSFISDDGDENDDVNRPSSTIREDVDKLKDRQQLPSIRDYSGADKDISEQVGDEVSDYLGDGPSMDFGSELLGDDQEEGVGIADLPSPVKASLVVASGKKGKGSDDCYSTPISARRLRTPLEVISGGRLNFEAALGVDSPTPTLFSPSPVLKFEMGRKPGADLSDDSLSPLKGSEVSLSNPLDSSVVSSLNLSPMGNYSPVGKENASPRRLMKRAVESPRGEGASIVLPIPSPLGKRTADVALVDDTPLVRRQTLLKKHSMSRRKKLNLSQRRTGDQNAKKRARDAFCGAKEALQRKVMEDRDWAAKQSVVFTQWLNFVLRSSATEEPEGDLTEGENAQEQQSSSWASALALRERARAHQVALQLYRNQEISAIRCILATKLSRGILLLRSDRLLHADVGLAGDFADLCLAYHPAWLHLGLETIFGENIPFNPRKLKQTLRCFIEDRLIKDPAIKMKYAPNSRIPSGEQERKYNEELAGHTLLHFLSLVLFLDKAKTANMIRNMPCLFRAEAGIKSSINLLKRFCRFLHGEGDVVRHLGKAGYIVTYSQTYIDEYNFGVVNLAVDLRDGVRLVRIVETLTGDYSLTENLRVPISSRTQKLQNVELALARLVKDGIIDVDVRAKDIVDGHQAVTLGLVWSMASSYQISLLVDTAALVRETADIYASWRWRRSVTFGDGSNDTLALALADYVPLQNTSGSESRNLVGDFDAALMGWVRSICHGYGIPVDNFTTCFADGRVLCVLIHYYHPKLLPLEAIRKTTAHLHHAQRRRGPGFRSSTVVDVSAATEEEYRLALEGERANAVLVNTCLKELGGLPTAVPCSDSTVQPDAKCTKMVVSYLAARLLESSTEIRSVIRIQRFYRAHLCKSGRKSLVHQCTSGSMMGGGGPQNRSQLLQPDLVDCAVDLQPPITACIKEDQLRVLSATYIQLWWRDILAILRYVRMQSSAATLIQACTRGMIARTAVRPLLYKIAVSKAAARCIHIWWRRNKRRLRYRHAFLEVRAKVIVIQRVVRRHIAVKQKLMQTAAILIQSQWRAAAARACYEKRQRATVALQAFTRMIVTRSHYDILKVNSHHAQALIGATFRCFMQRRWYKQILDSVIAIQSFARRLRAAKHVFHLREEVASFRQYLSVQAQGLDRLSEAIRISALRSAFDILTAHAHTVNSQRSTAAITLQSHVRSFSARRLRDTLATERKSRIAAENFAAIRLQSWQRVRVAIFKCRLLREQQEDALKREHASSTLLQSWWRMMSAKSELNALRALRDQQQRRQMNVSMQAKLRALEQKTSAVRLQTWWRVVLARSALRTLQRTRNDTLSREAAAAVQIRLQAMEKLLATIRLQCWWRCQIAKNTLKNLRVSRLLQQKEAIAASRAKILCMKERRCAVKIQAWWRMVRALILFKSLKSRKDAERRSKAATKAKARALWHKQRASTIRLQAWWRTVSCKKVLLLLRKRRAAEEKRRARIALRQQEAQQKAIKDQKDEDERAQQMTLELRDEGLGIAGPGLRAVGDGMRKAMQQNIVVGAAQQAGGEHEVTLNAHLHGSNEEKVAIVADGRAEDELDATHSAHIHEANQRKVVGIPGLHTGDKQKDVHKLQAEPKGGVHVKVPLDEKRTTIKARGASQEVLNQKNATAPGKVSSRAGVSPTQVQIDAHALRTRDCGEKAPHGEQRTVTEARGAAVRNAGNVQPQVQAPSVALGKVSGRVGASPSQVRIDAHALQTRDLGGQVQHSGGNGPAPKVEKRTSDVAARGQQQAAPVVVEVHTQCSPAKAATHGKVSAVTDHAQEPLGAHISSAVTMLKSDRLTDIIRGSMMLELSTRYSEICCQVVASSEAPEVICTLLESLDHHAPPHQRVLKYSLQTFRNMLAHSSKLSELLAQSSSLLNILMMAVIAHGERQDLYLLAVRLLSALALHAPGFEHRIRQHSAFARIAAQIENSASVEGSRSSRYGAEPWIKT